YLSPEQWKGESASERTDQFSYCVTLYEALYGMHPSAKEQRSADGTGKPPHWVRRIIVRGLSADPADRYPSMQQLLFALHRGLRAMRYRRWIAASAVALLALGIAADQAEQMSARRKAGLDLQRAVALLQTKWSEELKVFDLKVEGDLRKDFLS